MNFVKLDGLVELSQGLCVNQKTSSLFSNNKSNDFSLPLLKIANMQKGDFDIFVSRDVNRKVIASENDLIYTRTGLIGYCFRGFNGVVHNNSFIINILDEQKLDKDYLFVVLNTFYIRNQAEKMARTSVQPDLTHEMFKSILIPFPNIEIQRKIAKIVLNINSQIERNNAMVQKLPTFRTTTYCISHKEGELRYVA